MALIPEKFSAPLRNPGPLWGYDFLRRAERALPARFFQLLLGAGTWVAIGLMPGQRRHSRAYLSVIFQRPPRLVEIWRHFFAYAQVMMSRIRAAEGQPHRCIPQPGCDGFLTLMSSARPALLGTFHFGTSDLLGFLLGTFKRHVHMIRLRLDNSRDTLRLSDRFGEWVTYIWVNQSDNLLFALKNAAQSGGSIAMMCDRAEYSSKLEPFDFLGTRRLFPFTIYHLAVVFRLPVVCCLSVPDGPDASRLHASPLFEPDPALSKDENFRRAHAHFQAFLHQLESLLHANPYHWFNFIPLNPPAPSPTPATPVPAALSR